MTHLRAAFACWMLGHLAVAACGPGSDPDLTPSRVSMRAAALEADAPEVLATRAAAEAVLARIETSYQADLATAGAPMSPVQTSYLRFGTPDYGQLSVRLSHHGIVESLWAPGLRIRSSTACSGEACSRSVLREHAGMFGLTDPDVELALVHTSRTASGDTVYRYEQRHFGLRVAGALLGVLVDGAGALRSIGGHLVPGLPATTSPLVSQADAEELARLVAGPRADVKSAELVWVCPWLVGGSESDTPQLAWHAFAFVDAIRATNYYLSASTGELLGTTPAQSDAEVREIRDAGGAASANYALLWQCPAAGGACCTNSTALNEVGATTVYTDVAYTTNCGTSRPVSSCGATVTDCINTGCSADACNSYVWADTVYDWWAAWDSQQTNPDRDSFDDCGGRMRIATNSCVAGSGNPNTSCAGGAWQNANFQGCSTDTCGQCGAGRPEPPGEVWCDLDPGRCGTVYLDVNWATRDIVAHEFHHGLNASGRGCCSCTAGVFHEGALREHGADAFGVVIDNDDWTVDNEGGTIRSVSNPPAIGDHPDNMFVFRYDDPAFDSNADGNNIDDCHWAHRNCGIGNRAFNLAGGGTSQTFDGVTVAGVTRTTAGHIWHRLFETYLIASPATYTDWRNALEDSALAEESGHGVTGAYGATEDATDAVGVFDATNAGSWSNPTNDTDVRPTAFEHTVNGVDRLYLIWRDVTNGHLKYKYYATSWSAEFDLVGTCTYYAPFAYARGADVRVLHTDCTTGEIRYNDFINGGWTSDAGTGLYTVAAPAGAYWAGVDTYVWRGSSTNRLRITRSGTTWVSSYLCGTLNPNTLQGGTAAAVHTVTDAFGTTERLNVAGVCAADKSVEITSFLTDQTQGTTFRPTTLPGAAPGSFSYIGAATSDAVLFSGWGGSSTTNDLYVSYLDSPVGQQHYVVLRRYTLASTGTPIANGCSVGQANTPCRSVALPTGGDPDTEGWLMQWTPNTDRYFYLVYRDGGDIKRIRREYR